MIQITPELIFNNSNYENKSNPYYYGTYDFPGQFVPEEYAY